ncbi:hypothetical protein PMZ80_010467 [Knufia obscura]|uniref:Uncharacterized protein n=1 Tax=Knufia obscura TaxID=1635080 RepID=A0ABR0R991_9EURO|nr:hypothetical protein PMZ80_010467 [Knufia obscura]
MAGNEPKSNSLWRPVSLTRQVLAVALLGALALLGGTTFLHYTDHEIGAVLFAGGSNDFTSIQDFLVRYLPTILVVLYGMLIAVIDLDVKRLEPWYQLSIEHLGRRISPLSCRYDTDFVLTVMARALHNRHWVVSYSSALFVLATVIIPAVQNSMFITRAESLVHNTTIDGARKLVGVQDQVVTMNSNFLNTAYSISWLQQTVPAFTTSQYAIAPFARSPSSDPVTDSTTLTSNTTKYWTDLSCWQPSAIEMNFTVNTTTLSDGRGCIANEVLDFSPFGVAKNAGNYEAHYSSGQSIVNTNDTLPGSCPQSPHLILVAWRRVTDPDIPPDYSTNGTAVAMFCEPSYYMQPGEASVAILNGTVISFSATGAKQQLSDEDFNRTNFETIISNGYSPSQGSKVNSSELRIDIADGVRIYQDSRLNKANVNYNTGYSSAMHGFALGISQLSPEELLDFDTLYATYSTVHKLLFALAMTHNFESSDAPAQSATHSLVLSSIHLVPAFAIATEALLLLVAMLCVLLLWLSPARQLCLSRNPDSLAQIMRLSRSIEVQDTFSRLSGATEEGIRKAVSASSFRLTKDAEGQPLLQRGAESESELATTKFAHVSTSCAAEAPKHLPEISWSVSGLVITSVGCSVAAFTALAYFSIANGGLNLPSQTEIVQQILLNFIPTAFATLLGAYLSLVCRVYSFLRPMEDLYDGHARAASTLLVDYTSLPPMLLFMSAFRFRHYLLALLSIATVLSAVLTVTVASLFQPQDVIASTPLALDARYQPNVISPYSFEVNQSTSTNVDSIYPTIANLSSSVNLPPWTTSSYGYLPIDLKSTTPTSDSAEYEFEALGYGADLDCVDLLSDSPGISAAIDFRKQGKEFRLWANYSRPDSARPGSEVTGCWYSHHMMYEDGFGFVNGQLSDGVSAFEISDYMQPINTSSTFDESDCKNITVKGWVRGRLVEDVSALGSGNSTFEYNATILSCEPRLRTQRSLLRTDMNGSIMSVTPLEPHNYSVPRTVNLTATLYTTMATTIERATGYWFQDPLWHTDTFARDWSNYVYKKTMGGNGLVDPSQPVPSFEQARQLMSDGFSRLFAVQLSFDSAMLLPLNVSARDVSSWDTSFYPEEAPGPYPIPAKEFHPTRRIFISQANFIISIAILAFDFVVLIAFRLRLRKPFLPRMPFTIASQIAFFSGSHVIDDVMKVGGDLEELDAKGYRYGYGRYIGKDGWVHTGIEREPFVAKLDDEKEDREQRERRIWWHKLMPWRCTDTVPGTVRINGFEFESIPQHEHSESTAGAKVCKSDIKVKVEERDGNWI